MVTIYDTYYIDSSVLERYLETLWSMGNALDPDLLKKDE